MTRGVRLTAAIGMLAGLVTACTSGTGTGPATSSGATASAPPASAATAPPSSPSRSTATATRTVPAPSSSAPSGGAGTAGSSCTDSDLSISSSGGNGAGGHNRYVLYFRNMSSATCVLHGYPGLDALAASGSLIAHARRTESGFMGGSQRGVPTVPVAPGQSASAIVEWQTMQPGTGEGCYKVSAAIAVTAANTTRAVRLDRSVAACGLQIHPTVPGRTGDLS